MWTNEETVWLKRNYPKMGQKACAEYLNKSAPSIRMKTFRLGLSLDVTSNFFKDFQARAANSKIGKKRPAQALVIKRLHLNGKLIKTDFQRKATSIRMKKWIADNGHPKGMLGLRHSCDTKSIMSLKSKMLWANPNYIGNQEARKQANSDRMMKMQKEGKLRHGHSRGHQGKRADLNNRYFRSSWESNYARYLIFYQSS